MSADFKLELAKKLREKFSIEDVVESTVEILRGATTKVKYKLFELEDGTVRKVPVEMTETVKPEDRARGLIMLDQLAYGGELGLSDKKVGPGNSADVYRRFQQPVDLRIIQAARDEDE